MGNIVTKLNLNRTPNLVENNSMVFAKNIRIDIDGTIHKDYSINPLSIKSFSGYDKLYDNILTRIIGDFNDILNDESRDVDFKDCTSYFLDKIKSIVNYRGGYVDDYKEGSFTIIDTISNSNEFYIFIDGVYITEVDSVQTTHQENMIICYDEKDDLFYPCNCNWSYSGGKIDGCLINNLLGEKILNIGETNSANKVPIKCINLSKSHYTDDESMYTQAPNIPITNLNCIGTFTHTIPNGVYQFYIRYKIREGFYTDWILASKELFAGNKNSTITNYGTLEYVNTHLDSGNSFVFNVEHLYKGYTELYESFQIGFIIAHDDAIYARAWKHFTFEQLTIKFDYKANDSEEVEVTDLTKSIFNLYNVGNITSFKNKLYISNYTETDFNEDLQSYANDVKIELAESESYIGYDNYPVSTQTIGSKIYISAFQLQEGLVNLGGTNGIIDKILSTSKEGVSGRSILTNACDSEQDSNDTLYITQYGIEEDVYRETLNSAKSKNTNNLKQQYGDNFIAVENLNTIDHYTVNGITYNNMAAAINHILNSIAYLTQDGVFVDSSRNTSNKFTVKIFRKCILTYYTYVPKPFDPLAPISNPARAREPEDRTKQETSVNLQYTQEVTIKFTAQKSKISFNNTDNLISYTTLIPYQKYKFYVHYIKQNGEITNGYYCGGSDAGIITAPYKDLCNAIIYPKFSNIIIPLGYSACFFSILHYAVNSSTVYNVKNARGTSGVVFSVEGSCMEMNTRLIPAFNNIEIRQGDIIMTGDYYHSSNSSIIRYFGANGVIYIKSPVGTTIEDDKCLYAINDYESSQEKDVSLVKCTPYIKSSVLINKDTKKETPTGKIPVSYDNYENLNLLGYICQISDTDRSTSIAYYSDGANAYRKQNIDSVIPQDGAYQVRVQFDELSKYTDANVGCHISDFNLRTTNKVNIYSNYNFNFLALSEEPKQTVKTYYSYSSTQTPSNPAGNSVLWRLLTSLTLSDTYILPSMYHSYVRKTYFPYSKNEITVFDNTVRSSILEGDEAKISIFKFDAEDYYNVPTNRGKIVNLISIGDGILVHTKDSMFKFTGSNSLQSSSGEIQPTETDVFKTGVSEIFGSDFGFAGIQDKEDCIVTENGYIFFDRDSGIIYSYAGQNQITKISDSIEKLFRKDKINNIRFANDYYNNRFFVCIWFGDNNLVPITLSFSLNENIKSFVSIHDFCFDKAFNTKAHCYFLTLDKNDICTVDKIRIGEYYKLSYNGDDYEDENYPFRKSTVSRLVMKDGESRPSSINIPSFYSIIDVICNANYEVVKTLDSIRWCSRYVEKENPSAVISDNMASELEGIYPCTYLKIYTDTCATKVMSMQDIANYHSINSPASYKAPRYNQGYWSLNYFKNILNAEDVFKYLDSPKKSNPDYKDPYKNNEYRSDQNSLIEGKYFVVRFEFSSANDFKLDTLNFNYKNKL